MFVCQGVIDLTTLPHCTGLHGKALDILKGLQCIHKLTHDHLVVIITKYKQVVDQHRQPIKFTKLGMKYDPF